MTFFIAKSTKTYVEFVKKASIPIFVGSKPYDYEESTCLCCPGHVLGFLQPVHLPYLQQERG